MDRLNRVMTAHDHLSEPRYFRLVQTLYAEILFLLFAICARIVRKFDHAPEL